MLIATLFIVIVCAVFGLVAFGIVLTRRDETETYEFGIETIGIVVDPQSVTGKMILDDDIYVKYQDEQNEEHIAKLNLPGSYQIGKQINIKFTPGRYEDVVFMSDHIDALVNAEQNNKIDLNAKKDSGAIK